MEFTELIKDFLDDAESHLSAIDSGMLLLETRGTDIDLVTGILRSLHTLKGNAGMMGFDSLKNYLHDTEGVLKKASEGGIALEAALEALLGSANVIRAAIREIGSGNTSPDLSAEGLALRDLLDGSERSAGQQNFEISSYLGTKTDTIRVDFKRLDTLLDLAGELLICKTRLNRIESLMRGELGNRQLVRELRDGLETMGRTVSGLQEGIMRARMIPVGKVFQKFRRMVRDLAKTQAKEIRLEIRGEETEIDKTIVDELEEPLMHLVRNAIDHGIEVPRDRVKKGKERQAVIRLSALQESNYVSIEVSDNGRGIDIEAVRESAVRKGVLQPGDSPDRNTLMSLIFSPGFSTRTETTDISGRGIGLDVVSRNITKLNGQISVESSESGTAFIIKLPLSLAIIPALMTEVAGEVYAVPLGAVAETVVAEQSDLHVINNHEVIRFRDRVIPVLRLSEFFGCGDARSGRLYLVIVGRGEKSIALAVERLRGKQEIVIKPLDESFGKSYGVAGASILGDGRIVLIVDVLALWKKNSATELCS